MPLLQKLIPGTIRAVLVVSLGLLTACSFRPYRIDIQQGNVVTAEQFAQLKVGMTQEQVRFLLGTPMLVDIFHQTRWDYHYRMDKGATREVDARGLSLYFNASGKLAQIVADEAFRAQRTEEGSGNKVYDLSGAGKS